MPWRGFFLPQPILCYEKGVDSSYTLTIKPAKRFIMSLSRPLTIQTTRTIARENAQGDDAARLILTMGGEFFYANDAFMKMANPQGLACTRFFDVAEFLDPDDVFRQSSLLFAAEDAMFSGLRSGYHTVVLKQTTQEIGFQFDLVKSAGGISYVIASAIPEDSDFAQNVSSIINKGDALQNHKAQNFLDLSNDCLCSTGSDGAIDSVNQTFSTLIGYDFKDLEGRNFVDLVHPDDKAAIRAALQTILKSEEPQSQIFQSECRLITKEAQILWMDWKHKKVDGILYSAGSDITAIKKQQMALMRREQQLQEAEAIGRMGHWHWKLGSQDIRFSDEVYRIFGVDRTTFHPTIDSVNDRLHRRDAGRMEQAFQRAVIEQNDHETDFRVITPDGETRHVKCQGRCEFDDTGDVIGLYGIMQDVTQTMQHERALLEAKEAAERAYAAKSQFLANMSHELRTPLNAIIGFSEMIQQQLLGPIGNDRYLDYIKGINESGQHLLDLITDILDMSKIEAGKYELAIEEVNAAKVIRLAIHMVESRASEKGIKINANIQDEKLKIFADRRALMQITLNLLSNAVKFSHQKGEIDVDCAVKNGFVSLAIKDHGIGIPAHKLPTITNPFEQAANQYSRNHEGSGLGLSITKELAELHGGSLHIESTLNVGTTVTIRLPMDARETRKDLDYAVSDASRGGI